MAIFQRVEVFLVELVLPLAGTFLAKEDATAHRADRVDRAEVIGLERARPVEPDRRVIWRILFNLDKHPGDL